MCRAGGRRCPSHTDPIKVANRNARRRALYAKQNRNQPNNETETETTVIVDTAQGTIIITPEQETYFLNTKARTETGDLIPVYHGAGANFTSFDPARLGQGNDSWGNGFYFTTNQSTAQGYATDIGTPEANVKEFYINLQNPMVVDGQENMSLNHVEFTSKQAANILKKHPLSYTQPDDAEEMNWIGDYLPEFWDKESHSKEDFDRMIDKVARENFTDVSWPELEGVFGRENGSKFLHAVHEETGYDGVVVNFEDSQHYVAWFPEQMKLTSNQTPTSTHEF